MSPRLIFATLLVVLCTSNFVAFYLHSRASFESQDFSFKEHNLRSTSLYSFREDWKVLNEDNITIPADLNRVNTERNDSNTTLSDSARLDSSSDSSPKLNISNQFSDSNAIHVRIKALQQEISSLQGLLTQKITPLTEVITSPNSAKTPILQINNSIAIQKMMYENNPYRKLGIYEEIMPAKYYNSAPGSKLFKISRYYGIIKNSRYCEQVDIYNLYKPQNAFESIKFVSDYAGDEWLIRQNVMPKFGSDVLPSLKMSMAMSKYGQALHSFPINATMFFFKRVMVHHYYEINKQMICLSQMYNHIPGHGVLTRKDLSVNAINDYVDKYKEKPQCIKEDVYFPMAYRLNKIHECRRFFDEIKSEKYNQQKVSDPIQYIIKVGYGAHRAAGLALLDNTKEKELRMAYADGANCGTIQRSLVAQKYISNPLLLDKGNKFDFRIYMLVASVDPLIVYYHDGFLRVSLSTYDKFSTAKNVHFTNTHLSKQIFATAQKKKEYQGMTEMELRDYQMWTMDELQDYLIETNKISDKSWLEKELRPKFKEAYIHLVRMAEKSFYKSSSVFELYGLDFVIDDNLNIWFIECNASPQLVGTSMAKSQFLTKMLSDMFELQNAYYRSRMKRVQAFIAELQKKSNEDPNLNYEEMKKEFKEKVNINKLEPEFNVSSTNEFELIMDLNNPGVTAYFGNLQEDCI